MIGNIAKAAANVSKTVSKILMCRPTHFQVRYAINPWMRPDIPVDRKKAMGQWELLKRTIEESGAEVEVMEPDGAEEYPDLVFAANSALVRGKKAYLANFLFDERKGERFFYKKWLFENGYQIFANLDIPFEGAGDALWAGNRRLFCGVGPRTDIEALYLISKFMKDNESDDFKIIGCGMVDSRFYHIDTCFCPLNESLAIYFPGAFDPVTRHNLANEIELIPVSEEEAMRFACNAVVVDSTVIMNQGPERTAKTLEQFGFETKFVDMSEFIKSGGSCKCCTLKLN